MAEAKKYDFGHVVHADFPEGINSHVQYGPVTKAMAVYPCQYQLVPFKRAAQFFMDIFGLVVSPGSICTFQENAYDQPGDCLRVAPVARITKNWG